MSLPESVYELLELFDSRGGRMSDSEIPERLRNALEICRGPRQLIVPVPFVGSMLGPPRDTIWKLSPGGKSTLALHREAGIASVPEAESGDRQPDENEWILVSEAVARLPFIRTVKALRKFAEDHPEKLRLRPHPKHGRRHQVSAADVLRLEMEHDREQFESLDRSAADILPSIADLGPLAERLKQTRARKRK